MIGDHAWWHFWNHDEWLAFIVVLVPALIAAWSAVKAASISRGNRNQIDTGNGRTIGQTVHDMAQQQEIAAAIQHTNTRELVQVVEHVNRVESKLDSWIMESSSVHNELLQRLDGIKVTQETEGGTK